MDSSAILTKLEEAARQLSIKVEYDNLKRGEINSRGGFCIVKGEKRVLLHKGLSETEKIAILTEIISTHDTDNLYLVPEIRERIQG